MTVCDRVMEDLKAYLDGELRFNSKWTVQRHLASCAGCRQELSELKALQTRLRSSDASYGELPAALRTRILAACSTSETPVSSPEPLSRPFIMRPRLAWGAVGGLGLLLFIALPTLMRPGGMEFAASSAARKALPEAPAAAISEPMSAGAPSMDSIRSARRTVAKDTGGAVRPETPKDASASPSVARPTFAASPTRGPIVAKSVEPGGQNTAARNRGLSERIRNFPVPGGGVAAPIGLTKQTDNKERALTLSTDQAKGERADREKQPQAATAPPGELTLGFAKGLEAPKSVNLILMVDDVAEKAANIMAVVQSAGGEVAREQTGLKRENGENITLDVPANKLSETIEQIKKQGDVVDGVPPGAEAQNALGFGRVNGFALPPLSRGGTAPSGAVDKDIAARQEELSKRSSELRLGATAQKPGLGGGGQGTPLRQAGAAGGAAGMSAGGKQAAGGFGGGSDRQDQAGQRVRGQQTDGQSGGMGGGRLNTGASAQQSPHLDAKNDGARRALQAGAQGVKEEARLKRDRYSRSKTEEYKLAKPRLGRQVDENRSVPGKVPELLESERTTPVQAPRVQFREEMGQSLFRVSPSRRYADQREGYTRITVQLRRKPASQPGAAGARKKSP